MFKRKAIVKLIEQGLKTDSFDEWTDHSVEVVKKYADPLLYVNYIQKVKRLRTDYADKPVDWKLNDCIVSLRGLLGPRMRFFIIRGNGQTTGTEVWW